jgi:energy-coupling factor transporter ATP-binding protein EcfA2
VTLASAATSAPRQRVVELVGPAGVGKSTLARVLPSADPRIPPALGLWGQPRHRLLASAVRLLPLAAAQAAGGRALRADEFAQMVRLDALHRTVHRLRRRTPGLLFLDEGPVFALAWLAVFHAADGDEGRRRWRREALAHWARTLAIVVRLEAADTSIAERIRGRPKPHMMKHRSSPEIHAFTARFRAAYDDVLGDLTAQGRVTVLDLHTDGDSATEDAARLRGRLAEVLREH